MVETNKVFRIFLAEFSVFEKPVNNYNYETLRAQPHTIFDGVAQVTKIILY